VSRDSGKAKVAFEIFVRYDPLEVLNNMPASLQYRLIASVFLLSASLCGAQDVVRMNPDFARDRPDLFITFQVPGAVGTYPMSINDSQTVTGYYTGAAGTQGGFVRSQDGTIDTFQVPGSILTEPVGINSAGEVVGYYEITAGVPQGFMRTADGQITTFAAPTDASISTNKIAQPVAINDAGEILGNYPDVGMGSRVFVRSATGVITTFSVSDGSDYSTVATGINAGGAITFYGSSSSIDEAGGAIWYGQGNVPNPLLSCDCSGLALPGATGMFPTGINATGAVVGWFTTDANAPYSQVTPDAPASGAFLRSPDGLITTFSSPGTLVSSHLGINAPGAIFGNYTLPATPTDSHGFVRSEEGIVNSFDPDRSSSTTATNINDSGVITGYYSDESGKVVSGFLRQPLEAAAIY
jgi:hypothetical protein